MRGFSSIGFVGLLVLAGCGAEEPVREDVGRQPLAELDRVDLLLVVDDSRSMYEKQQVLADSIRRVVTDLVNPPCVDENGVPIDVNEQPLDGQEECPSGSERIALPVVDLHIGVISSSLGDLAGNVCEETSAGPNGGSDGAHLMFSDRQGGDIGTYQGFGYLAWDPNGELSPPGESNVETLIARTTELVIGVGEIGCGYEMPLEAAIRFLADPAPYADIEIDENGEAVPVGLDQALLDQRAAFLRSDSIVSVVLLTDENDCSVAPQNSQFIFDRQTMSAPTLACATDPHSVCCLPCGAPAPETCTTSESSCPGVDLASSEDPLELRCFDQKRRYGFDFMYPIARYENALSATTIDPTAIDWAATQGGVENPLFIGDREPGHVIFTTITGVPWQDVALDPGDPSSRVKSPEEMELDGTWDHIVGDGASPPTDPFMVESVSARRGVNPFTGEDVAGPNTINGGERAAGAGNVNLQYACLFSLAQPLPEGCANLAEGDPRCIGATMVAEAAYPGRRQLELARALGDRAVVGSICPPMSANAPNPAPEARSYTRPLELMKSRIFALMPKTR